MDRRIVIPHADALNSYLSLLRSAMARSGVVVEHLDSPWSHDPAITWIHWPEAIFHWREPDGTEVARFARWIRARASGGLVVWTVHNAFPHGRRGSEHYREVYRLVAECAHVHLHHGGHSIRVIAERYPAARPLVVRTHPHGGYWQLVGDLSPEAARDRLGLSGRGRILLAFGEVRDPRELYLAFRASRAPGWHVLLAGRLHSYGKPLRFLMNRLVPLIPTRRWTVLPGSVPDERVDAYVKAADAVFIPRYEALNSGNVFLGFTFGKAVLGPHIGNIGEVLALTGNPTFDPADPRSIGRALSALSREGAAELGRRNGVWLRENGQWDQTAAIARDAIEEAIGRLRERPAISDPGGAAAPREAGP